MHLTGRIHRLLGVISNNSGYCGSFWSSFNFTRGYTRLMVRHNSNMTIGMRILGIRAGKGNFLIVILYGQKLFSTLGKDIDDIFRAYRQKIVQI